MTAFLLIHGGGTTGRFWDRLLGHLPGPALAPDLPGRGAHPRPIAELTVAGGSASVLQDVAAWGVDEDDDLVLIAHSSGGLFTPGVVAGLRRACACRGVERGVRPDRKAVAASTA